MLMHADSCTSTQVEVDGVMIGLEPSSKDLLFDYPSKLMLEISTSDPQHGKAGNNRCAKEFKH